METDDKTEKGQNKTNSLHVGIVVKDQYSQY